MIQGIIITIFALAMFVFSIMACIENEREREDAGRYLDEQGEEQK